MLPKKRPPTHPGEILWEEFLKPLGITQTDFAKHLGWSHAKVNEIIAGKRGVTPETALSFADALGTSPEVWLNLQRSHDLWRARRSHEKKSRLSNVG